MGVIGVHPGKQEKEGGEKDSGDIGQDEAGGEGAKISSLTLKNCIIILKLVRLQGEFNTEMKQHNRRTNPHQKMLQNQTPRSESRSSQENDEQPSIQELKVLNNETQFLFKKQERGARQRPKDSLPERKLHTQPFPHLENASDARTLKKNEMLSGKLPGSDSLTRKQQYEQIRAIQKGKRQSKLSKHPNAPADSNLDSPSNHLQKENEKRSKKETKLSKKAEKEKERGAIWTAEGERVGERGGDEQRGAISNQLLQVFRSKYGYYLIDNKIVFPIEDHLFLQYPELQEQRSGVFISPERLITPLPDTFSKELQIWNMIIEHAAFFELDEEVTIQSVASMLSDQSSPQFTRLFKNFHKFYINELIFQRYEEASGEDYFSFISLWRYAEENSFLDKLFHTSWNKFVLFYISLQKHYSNPVIQQELQAFQSNLNDQLSAGYFSPPKEYSLLLDYLIFLINMCFETHTFKALINNKMLFFRDNNKMKNQLLQQKKDVENRLWELKEAEKQILKREKANAKLLKKEQKQQIVDKAYDLQKESVEIQDSKVMITEERERLQGKILEIDNKIYELCCLPEFSNVWLLGQDKHKNLYWFIKEQESAIYRECRKTGEWGMIQYENIELFHQQLNHRGIKEHKLYDKILYYKQLGYIKTERDEPLLAASPKSHPQSLASSSSPAKATNGRSSGECLQFQRFSYMQFRQITPLVVKQMILKSQSMMSKYLFERNSKWTTEENRQEYINKIINHDLTHYESLTQELRTFNEKICVVEINIRITNEENAQIQSKTRKIQTKIWGINEKYKHFWYDYSRRCRSLSDLHFLVSVLYLTIEKYVTKTRKPNNTKYFFKTVQLGENIEPQDHFGEQELIM